MTIEGIYQYYYFSPFYFFLLGLLFLCGVPQFLEQYRWNNGI